AEQSDSPVKIPERRCAAWRGRFVNLFYLPWLNCIWNGEPEQRTGHYLHCTQGE
ncbi:hypothetical protein HGM15179_018615, partial [Zosterops borbonicus]